jgi:hypoxanthine phosphoribosyltransferase
MNSYDYQNRTGIQPISWEELHEMCKTLAEGISLGNFEIVLGIARGGLYPATLISAMLQKEIFPIRITRRENDQIKYAQPIWKVDITDDVLGQKVLIVDDIADTGETLQLVVKRACEKGATIVTTMTVVTHSWSNPQPDYFYMVTDALVIFPWDTHIWVNDAWQLHPELIEAIKKQG